MKYETAENRVDNTPELEPYRDLLLEYDWDNMDDHLVWVATAPTAEIVAWAEQIRSDEASLSVVDECDKDRE